MENILSAAIFDQVSIFDFGFEETEFLGGHFRNCIFKNCRCRFQNTLLRKCEFLNCIFQNCEILDCEFLKTELHDINFKATKINSLKIQNTTGSDLHFNKKFPMYFWKSNHCIKITDSISFEKFLKDMIDE